MTALLRLAATGGVLSALTASSLLAQRPGYIIPTPQGQPRVAGIAPPPPEPRTQYRPGVVRLGETVFGSVPAVVTADGRVLVNYGYGYEEVGRICPGYYAYGCQAYGIPLASTPAYGAPVYGAPVYPTPNYPPAGYVQSSYGLPTSGYGSGGTCPTGYVPTGGYPPCIDPARSATGNLHLQPSSRGPGAAARPSARPTGGPRATSAPVQGARVLVPRHR